MAANLPLGQGSFWAICTLVANPSQLGGETEAQRVYAVCGRVVLAWPPVERAIDLGIARLRSLQGAQRTPSRKAFIEFPASFQRKRRELKQRWRAEPMLADELDRLLGGLLSAKLLHDRRSIVAHGILQARNGDELEFSVADHRTGFMGCHRVLRMTDLESATAEMLELAAEFERLALMVPMTRA